jgi:hypothetical protein
MKKELTIDGQLYRAVEPEKPKERERIEGWANVYEGGHSFPHMSKEYADLNSDRTNRLECVRLVELRDDERVVSRKKVEDACIICGSRKSFLEYLGFDDEVKK